MDLVWILLRVFTFRRYINLSLNTTITTQCPYLLHLCLFLLMAHIVLRNSSYKNKP